LPPGSDRTITNLASLFYFSNLLFDNYLGNLPHLWSLSVEEHFYFIWPLLCITLLFKLKDNARIVFLIVAISLLEVFRLAAYANQEVWAWGMWRIDPYGFTLCRIDCMLIGALIFFVVYRPKYNYGALTPSRYDNLWLILLSIVFVGSGLFISFQDHFWLGGGYVVTNALCALIVIITLRNPNHPFLTHPWIKWLGVRSYGIYLYHMPIFTALEVFRVEHSKLNFFVVLFFRFALSIAAAALSYQFIELPFLRYKNNRRKARNVAPKNVQFERNWQNNPAAAVVAVGAPNASGNQVAGDTSSDTTSVGN
jgi:peptidoglycan/LPS O-acetylase OafA/YrhL